MATVELTGYRADDMPACLAAAGLVRVLARYASCAVRLSWGQMHPTLHLPGGVSPDTLADILRTTARARAGSPHWALLDTCDDGAAWEAAARQVVVSDPRDGGDFLTAAACYVGGEGGRSPLICTARNMTPGRWAKKNATVAAATDWLAHFVRWSASGDSWQGWRPPQENRGADPAAVWLGLEGLTYFACSLTPAWERPRPAHLDALTDVEGVGMAPPYEPAARRDVLCPGWDHDSKQWRFPLWESPVGMDVIQSLVGCPDRIPHAAFRRAAMKMGNYYLSAFGPGMVMCRR